MDHLRLPVLGCLLLCATAATAASAGEAVSAWTMPATDKQALMEVVERAIAAGLPDARGGTLLFGKLTVAQKDPAGGGDEDTQSYEGLHLRLADGTWLVNVQQAIVAGPRVVIDDQALQPIALDQVMARSLALVGNERTPLGPEGIQPGSGNGGPGSVDQSVVERFAAEQRPMIAAAGTTALEALTIACQASEGRGVVAAHLLRLGLPQAELLIIGDARDRALGDVSARVTDGRTPPLILSPDGSTQPGEAVTPDQAPSADLRSAAPVMVLRHALCEFFLASLLQDPGPFRALPAERAAAAGLAMISADDPVAPLVRERVARLLARAALPRRAAEGADLAGRLASAEGDGAAGPIEGDGGLTEEQFAALAKRPAQEIASFPVQIRTAIDDYRNRQVFTVADLGALLALVGDPRPSRWLDEVEVRSVGDNALRYASRLLGFDPRPLVGRDPAAPWTAAERTATATALAAWWKANQGRPLAEILADALPRLSLDEVAHALAASDTAQRAVLFDRLVAVWTAQPPHEPSPTALASLLVLARGHAGLDALVGGWPVQGPLRPLLAAWRLEHGDPKPFDALFDEALSPPVGGDLQEAVVRIAPVLRIACRHPTADRLQRLLTACGAPAGEMAGEALRQAVMQLDVRNEELSVLWGEHDDDGSDPELGDFPGAAASAATAPVDQALAARAAIPFALLAALASDQRPATPEQAARVGSFSTDGTAPRRPAADLRLADVTAKQLPQFVAPFAKLLGREVLQQLYRKRFDFSAPRETRDHQLLAVRRLLAIALVPALRAAKLPTTLPGITDVQPGGDDQAAF